MCHKSPGGTQVTTLQEIHRSPLSWRYMGHQSPGGTQVNTGFSRRYKHHHNTKFKSTKGSELYFSFHGLRFATRMVTDTWQWLLLQIYHHQLSCLILGQFLRPPFCQCAQITNFALSDKHLLVRRSIFFHHLTTYRQNSQCTHSLLRKESSVYCDKSHHLTVTGVTSLL